MKITSGILEASAMNEELLALPNMLAQFGVTKVEAFFGFGCEGSMDDLYQSAILAPDKILDWVASEGARVGFKMSRGDLYIEAENKIRVQFCHDSDIHVEGEDAQMVATIEHRWRQAGFAGYILIDEKWVSFSEATPNPTLKRDCILPPK